MNYRLSTLFAQKSYSADATEVIDITLNEPISELIINHQVLNGASASMTNHPINCITKVELVDGSDVLYSLSGPEIDAIDWYELKRVRSPWKVALNGNYTDQYIGLHFGRFLWDPQLALIPGKFKNPQLKISLDVDAGGQTPTTNKLEVFAALFDEKAITPMGFLMHKEIKNYAMGAATHEYTDLPTDFPYRKLFIRQKTLGTEPNQVLAHIKLAEEFDKKVILDHDANILANVIMCQSPPYIEHWLYAITTSQLYIMCTPTTRTAGVAAEWAETAAAAVSFSVYDGDGGRLKVIGSAGRNAQVFVEGWLPHGVWELPLCDPNNIEDFYDVSKIKNLRLDLLSAAGRTSSDTVQVFLQQLRKY